MRCGIFVAAVLLVVGESARGATLRIDFAGTVSDVSGTAAGGQLSDPEAAIGGSIHVGTPFTGYFILDDAAVPTDVVPEEPGPLAGYSSYLFAWPAAAMHTEIGSYVTEADYADADAPTGGFQVIVSDYEAYADGASPSHLSAWARVAGTPAPPAAELVLTQVQFDLEGAAPGLPLHSTSLQGFPWSLESFPVGLMHWYFENGDSTSVGVEGQLDQLSFAPVPEPGSAALVALAAAGLCVRRLRRARSWCTSLLQPRHATSESDVPHSEGDQLAEARSRRCHSGVRRD